MGKTVLKRFAMIVMSLAVIFTMQITTNTFAASKTAVTENVGDFTVKLTKKGTKKSVSLSKNTSISITAVEKESIVPTSNLKFTSSKKSVATVSNKGIVTAKKAGTSKIVVTNKKTKKKSTLTVKVEDFIDVSVISLNNTELTLCVGENYTLTAGVDPLYSAVPKWRSFLPEIATVENGVVTAVSPGTGIIAACAGTKVEICRVTVTEANSSSKPIILNLRSAELLAGEGVTVTAKVKEGDASDISWGSSDSRVATVNNGYIKGISTGTATITAYYGKEKATCQVTVYEDNNGNKDPNKVNCSIQISCANLVDYDGLSSSKKAYVPGDGMILKKTTMSVDKGSTVFDVLKQICQEKGVHLASKYVPTFDSYYIEGINHIFEYDAGPMSGWIYKVNGVTPNYGASSYVVSEGDEIVWGYSINGTDDV
ncbi:MAG: DUF4430 domain-containing protein [Lachnospiraceae bacterium]|nr:DUF4430 domain-containing protein [Lachnospiraceae bacterium]